MKGETEGKGGIHTVLRPRTTSRMGSGVIILASSLPCSGACWHVYRRPRGVYSPSA